MAVQVPVAAAAAAASRLLVLVGAAATAWNGDRSAVLVAVAAGRVAQTRLALQAAMAGFMVPVVAAPGLLVPALVPARARKASS
jgi:hypothetical protein